MRKQKWHEVQTPSSANKKKKKGESRPTFLTWRRISSRRDICSLSFLSTLDSYSACGGETKARQLQRKKSAREPKRELFFFWGFGSSRVRRTSLSTSFCPNFAIVAPLAYDPAFSLSLSLSLASRARFCSFRHAPPLSFPFLDEAFRSHVDRFFLHCEFGERQ